MTRDRKKRDKAERRAMRKADRASQPGNGDGEDPDIAGIVPGPQPLPWDDEPLDEDEQDEQ